MFVVQLVEGGLRGGAEGALEALLVGSAEGLDRLGSLSLVRWRVDQQWWRAFSAIWLHGGALHLGLNALSLASIGAALERRIGSVAVCLLFLVAGLIGNLAVLSVAEGPGVVGASGGICGLAGALAVILTGLGPGLEGEGAAPSSLQLAEYEAGVRLWRGLGLLLLLGAGLSVASGGWVLVANSAHAAGIVVGAVAAVASGWAAAPWLLQRGAFGVGAGMCALCAFGAARPVRPLASDLMVAYGLSREGRHVEAAHVFESAMARGADGAAPLLNAAAYTYALAEQELPRAATLARRALALVPEDRDVQDTAGWIDCLQGETAQGLELLRSAADQEHPPTVVVIHVAVCAGWDAARRSAAPAV